MNGEEKTTDGKLSVAGETLMNFIEEIEGHEEQKKNFSEMIKEIYAEAKARGYDVKTIRKIVSIRKKKKEVVEEENFLLDLYLEALKEE